MIDKKLMYCFIDCSDDYKYAQNNYKAHVQTYSFYSSFYQIANLNIDYPTNTRWAGITLPF